MPKKPKSKRKRGGLPGHAKRVPPLRYNHSSVTHQKLAAAAALASAYDERVG